MKVSMDMIDRQYRRNGRFMKVFLRYKDEKALVTMGRFSQKVLGNKKSLKLNNDVYFIEREDSRKLLQMLLADQGQFHELLHG